MMKTLRWGPGLVAAATTAFLSSRRLRRGDDYDFEGKTVWITGGSRGLGLELARRFADEGARLVLTARDAVALDRARHELEARGAEVLVVPGDVADRAAVAKVVASAVERFGTIDVLVNNAGVIQVGPMETMTEEDFDRAMRTHFWGPYYAIQECLPLMRRSASGRIVNISSIGGRVPAPHLLPYVASKFALTGFSEALAVELARHGVRVTTVIPGLMRTGSPGNAWFKGKHRAEHAWFHVSDSMPLLSVSSRRAAREIVTACRRGDPQLVLGGMAKLATWAHALLPAAVVGGLRWVNRLLPGNGGIGAEARRGYESESALAPSALTLLSNRAARRNNEFPEAGDSEAA